MTTVERVLNARSVVPVASSSASLTYLSTTSTFSAVHLLHLKPFSSLLRSSSTSFFAGKSGYVLESRRGLRSSRRSHLALTNLIKAAFLVEWIGKLINFLAKTPAKMFAQKLEDDLDKAAKMVKTAAGIVASIARETDEFAEEVERIAEQTEKFAEKVSEVTEKIETEIDDILDVIEGEKKLVVTSYQLVENENQAALQTTSIEKDDSKTIVIVESSVVSENSNNSAFSS
ncbi:hypothetical protein KP509_35G051500 [Ceratopteris richardii]|uniref:Uncharacterized protein n=2 Tax=Ceratopteris richardii TaxID=49495 RepID=A0A8T2QH43_CERRI|nr:hypothetical protein KP509_35G051500 [Ceratopteris richardii]